MLQVVEVALNLAGIPFPKISAVTKLICEIIAPTCTFMALAENVYEGVEKLDDKLLEKIKKER